ncbi:hypothetical protein FHX57_002121 [Paraburkholderia tropica]|uniref:hypothetical protein n=1 Tax=Paraburkholderia tropica TaxID=92647 RepID=UPI00161B06A5|nr:hypothetical protein [Paraburkholderia tropica]MBB2999790.1 hypothetical protein [Paraburkholderia tropica]
MTLAEYSRRINKSRATVTQWKQAGKIVMRGNRVDVEASDAKLGTNRSGGMPKVVNSAPSVKRGRPSTKRAGDIDLGSTAPIELRAADVQRTLVALDGKLQFDWSESAQRERARQAARCVGFIAAESAIRDDGHWGGFQLRGGDYVIDGYGYELMPWNVVRHCREQAAETGNGYSGGDLVTVIPALLPLLALPLCHHAPQWPHGQ